KLERETESCGEQLADTLDELRMRMTPGEVVDQLVDYAQDTTGGLFFENLKQEVTRNPLPVALMGAGFLWLICGKAMNGSRLRQGAASLRGRGREWLSESSDAAGAAQRDAARRLDETASRVREAAGAARRGRDAGRGSEGREQRGGERPRHDGFLPRSAVGRGWTRAGRWRSGRRHVAADASRGSVHGRSQRSAEAADEGVRRRATGQGQNRGRARLRCGPARGGAAGAERRGGCERSGVQNRGYKHR